MQLIRYRRSVAQLRTISLNEISNKLPITGKTHVSQKIDGELWFLVYGYGDPLVNARRNNKR